MGLRMRKNVFCAVLLLLACSIVILTVGCVDTVEVPEIIEESIIDDTSYCYEVYEEESIEEKAEYEIEEISMDGILYTFSGRTNYENMRYANGAHELVRISREVYALPRVRTLLSISFTEEDSSFLTSSAINMNPNDLYSLGVIFFFTSGEALPAWLAAGMELYWLEQIGLNRFTIIDDVDNALSRKQQAPGDEWFIDGFLDDGLNEDSITILYGFVRHLSQSGTLDNLVNLYLSRNTRREAEELRACAWLSFTSNEVNSSTAFHFLYGNGIIVHTCRGEYTFCSAEWSMEILNSRVTFMERGIEFAFNWFDIEQEESIRISLFASEGVTYGFLWSSRRIHLYNALEYPPLAITHEVVHYIQYNYSVGRGFRSYMLEGLAEAVAVHQAKEDEVFRGYLLGEFNHIDMWSSWWQHAFRQLSNVEILTCGEIELRSMLRIGALKIISWMEWTQETPTFFDGGLPEVTSGINPHDREDGFLFTYTTAKSFSLFLLDLGTREDYLRFYSDRNLAEEIYGKDFAALIDKWWYEYLEVDRNLGYFLQVLEDWENGLLE